MPIFNYHPGRGWSDRHNPLRIYAISLCNASQSVGQTFNFFAPDLWDCFSLQINIRHDS
jgi:hypothetical protein